LSFTAAAIIGLFVGGILKDIFTSKVTILIAIGAITLSAYGLSLTREKGEP
jgi:hypothetical protein